jgi:hypothetical protein
LEGKDGIEMAAGDSEKYRYIEGMSTVADHGEQKCVHLIFKCFNDAVGF